ncbi:uncharacterized protein LOC117120781 [Anneissia japonica]|uniref:uncharacterized protein LOC117120781 n=1 Tax=Anneissia japonica TaxID=1529436 RepID=UPI00142551B4|nr:uncharacterized protein LOC117120781 [Anneissia japonica]
MEMLGKISDAITKQDEKYVDMLRVLYRDLANVKTELEEAKSAFDLFKRLIAPGILKPTDISVLFETIELTGLKYLKETIEKYERYPDKVEIIQFSPHRQQVVALGKEFSLKDLQKVSQLYKGNFSNQWKLIQHLEDTFDLTENSILSFLQRLKENDVNEGTDFNQLLVKISYAISKEDEKYIDMLRVLYKDFATITTELEEAKSAFDLFQILNVAGILKPTDISVLFQTIELTGLKYLKEITEKYETYPAEVKIAQFSEHRQRVVDLGKKFSTLDIQRIGQMYKVPDGFCSNSWKLIAFLESEGVVSEVNFSSFLKNFECVDKSRRSRLDEDEGIKQFLTNKLKRLYRNENQITPAIWHKKHAVDIAEVFTELSLLKSEKEDEAKLKSTGIIQEGKQTTLKKVLDVIRSKDSCKLLITGKGGIGKTTLLKYITHKWATDKDDTFVGKLLFLISIGNIRTKTKFLDVILENIDMEEYSLQNNLVENDPVKRFKRFLVNHADDVVILLDGYDELQKDAKDPIYLFKGLELEKSAVVITSRPENIIDLVKCCTVHVEVNGFSEGNIMKYITNHFNFIEKEDLGKLLSRTLRGYDHKEAFELCSTPLLLLMICTMWEQEQHLPKDLSDLLKKLICSILRQHKVKSNYETAADFSQIERIPEKYRRAILLLGGCMYEGLKENKLSIDKYVLSEMNQNSKSEVEVDFALELGFVYEDQAPVNRSDTREIFIPPHKLISETLACLYLTNQIEKECLKADEYEVIRSNKYLNVTRAYTLKFLGAKAGKLLNHWLIIRASNYYSIAQCFTYIKDENEECVMNELDTNMSTEMKLYCEKMCETLKSVLEVKRRKKEPLFKLMNRCCIEYERKCETLEEKMVSLVDTSSEDSVRKSCRSVVHISVIVQGLNEGQVYGLKRHHLFRHISNWKDNNIGILSAEMKYLQLKYSDSTINLDFKFNSSFLIHLLSHSDNLSTLKVANDRLTEAILSVVTKELRKTQVKLKLTELDINHTDLHNIDGTVLGKLFEIAPKLIDLNISSCRLSGDIVRAMITECQNSGAELEGCKLDISNNDIDDAILGDILEVYPNISSLKIASCGLSEESFNKMVANEFPAIELCKLDFSQNDLRKLDGEIFGILLQKLPKLNHFSIKRCILSGSIFNEMMEKCSRIKVVLKDNMLNLKGNDLSDIDSRSLAELVRVMHRPYDNTFTWNDYSLTDDNIKKLVQSVSENMTLNWRRIDLRKINLSSVSGKTLAQLLKVSPDLLYIDMGVCSLSGSTVNEMMEECGRMNVVLKNSMLNLEGNDLSNIDGKSLAELVRVMHVPTLW